MEQKDYLLREIEKISLLLRALINSLKGKDENLAITVNSINENTKEQLFEDMGFDIHAFVAMQGLATKAYIAQFIGLNTANLELLAEVLTEIGIQEEQERRRTFLEKALFLYKLCNESDKTYSVAREYKIEWLKKIL